MNTWQEHLELLKSFSEKRKNLSQESLLHEIELIHYKYSDDKIVEGRVCIKAPFGIFIDFGEIFLGLIEIIHIPNLDYQQYRLDEIYAMDSLVNGRIVGFNDQEFRVIPTC